MIQHKLHQASSNRESLLTALNELDKSVSSRNLEQYLEEKAVIHARKKFEQMQYVGEVDGQDMKSYIKNNSSSMNLRTIQRLLKDFFSKGYVIREHNKYELSITVK